MLSILFFHLAENSFILKQYNIGRPLTLVTLEGAEEIESVAL